MCIYFDDTSFYKTYIFITFSTVMHCLLWGMPQRKFERIVALNNQDNTQPLTI